MLSLFVLAFAAAAEPRLLMTTADLDRINSTAATEAWAQGAKNSIVTTAQNWPKSHLTKYGLSTLELPPDGGQWTHYYVCPTHGARLQYAPPGTHRCPVNGQTFSGWPYDQVVYTNRHSDLAGAARDLALAFRFTGIREYAERAAEILTAYAAKYRDYPLHDVNGKTARTGGRVLSQTLDESVWLIPLAWAYDLLNGTDVLTSEQHDAIEQNFLRAAVETIQRNDAGISNWQSWHNAAIAAVGFTLGDADLIRAAIDGKSGFRFQMANSILGEGFWYEGAWGYHFYALDPLVQTAEMAARSGIDLWGEEPNLTRMFTAPLGLMFADGTLPAFNDSGYVNLFAQDALYEVAYARTGNEQVASVLGRRARGRNALFWGAPELQAVAAPPLESGLFEESGYAVLRAAGSDHAAIVDFGPHGGGHGHYDKLGFISFGRGRLLGLDAATQAYSVPSHATWDLMTVAHNTIVVDERRQDPATGRLLWSQFGEGYSAVSADAGPAYKEVELQRTMLLTADYLLDVFNARSTTGAERTFDWVYHNEGQVETELPLEPWAGFGKANGYQHLTANRAMVTSETWRLNFDSSPRAPQPWGSTYSSGSAKGRAEYTTEQAASGRFGAKLQYEFGGSGYLLYSSPVLAAPRDVKPVTLSVMIHGNGSGHKLALRLYDNTDERFVARIGPVDWTGWRRIEVSNPEKWNHYLGNNDAVFDTPVRTFAIELTANSPESGALYADDATITFDGVPSLQAADWELLSRHMRLTVLPAPETTVITGNGLGPDLTKPVPYVLARRKGSTARFAALLEPHGGEPAVASVEEFEPGSFRIQASGWTDTVRITDRGLEYNRERQ